MWMFCGYYSMGLKSIPTDEAEVSQDQREATEGIQIEGGSVRGN